MLVGTMRQVIHLNRLANCVKIFYFSNIIHSMNTYVFVAVTAPFEPVVPDTTESRIFTDDIDDEFFGIATIVHLGFERCRINFVESPVSATVVESVSIIVADTLGVPVAVTVKVQVAGAPRTVVLLELLYVRHVILHFPVFAFGICA